MAAKYHRLAARRGKKKALAALAHTILKTAYCMLKCKLDYKDLGEDYYEQRDRQAGERQCVHRLEKPGNNVSLTATTQASS